jgi:mannose-1-phosphate guanylyltransferase/mannose-6-phosphate isomerase
MIALVLAGGSGTRLWPFSRQNYPKQFLKLNSNNSLLQQTIDRLLEIFTPSNIIVMTNNEYKFHVISDINTLCDTKKVPHITNMILEPTSRNTAPAIALGIKFCLEKLKSNENEVIFVFPSDHIIKPPEKFIEYIKAAKSSADKGNIVTFGIIPTRPETGYGYIKLGQKLDDYIYTVDKFTEKPDLETAKLYVKSGEYYWNSGIFAFSIKTMLSEFRKHMPQIMGMLDMNLIDILTNFHEMPEISIDYAVAEKSEKIVVLPMDLYWNDIGSWDSLYEYAEKDEMGNIKLGDIITINTRDSLIFSNKRLVSTIGLEDCLIIDTEDALLVSRRGEAQKVKDIVKELNNQNRKEAIEHVTTYRPWGSYTVLEEGERYKIKRIVVNPGQRLSLQMHHHRSEHWVVVKGSAKVTIGNKELFIHENESAYVPKSTLHRLENPGKIPLEIIEVQNGEYLNEDDIVRFDDIYGRSTE